SFSSAMVMIHLNPIHSNVQVSAFSGDFQRRVFREDKTPQGRRAGLFYAARRCASAKFSGSDNTSCRSAPAIRSKTPFIVSWILVLGRWNFRVALEASWQSIYRFRNVCKASNTRSERIVSCSFLIYMGISLSPLFPRTRQDSQDARFLIWAHGSRHPTQTRRTSDIHGTPQSIRNSPPGQYFSGPLYTALRGSGRCRFRFPLGNPLHSCGDSRPRLSMPSNARLAFAGSCNARVERTLPSTSSEQALSAASDLDFASPWDGILNPLDEASEGFTHPTATTPKPPDTPPTSERGSSTPERISNSSPRKTPPPVANTKHLSPEERCAPGHFSSLESRAPPAHQYPPRY